MERGILVAFVGLLAVAAQVFFANKDSFLFVSQMQAKGFSKGLPLIAHAGIWGDLIILTPLLTMIVGIYSDRWNAGQITTASIIGLVVTVVMGFLWVNGAKHGLPEAHTHGGSLTMAGFIHAMYMAAAIAVIVLFFFNSGISQKAAIFVSVVLAIHLIYGTHIILGLIAPDWYPARPHKQFFTWATVLPLWGALAWRCITIH